MTYPLQPPRPPASPRRGAASLVVVMVLFFVITLVAAYTSRNLLFEQRTSTNQFRSTLAFEAAEAGVEWALARLNDARMNNNCTPLTTAASVGTEVSFRQRYLTIDGDTGAVAPVAGRVAGCIFNGTTWVCDCPATGNPNPTVVYTGNGPFAAFWVRFLPVTPVAAGVTGIVRMQVNACTRADVTCLDFTTREAQSGDGLATVWSMVVLRGGLASLPAAAVTSRGAFSRTAGAPIVSNADTTSGGFTVHGGAAVDTTGVTLNTVPGTPPSQSFLQNDTALALPDLAIVPATPANSGTNRMFNSVFGMWPATYGAQPALASVNCSADCTATDVNNQVLLRPGNVIHLQDGGTAGHRLRIGADIGTAANPVVIVADPGVNVEFDAGTHTVYGVVYSRAATWQLRGGNGTIRGAAIAEQAFEFNADDPSIVYDRDVLLRARYQNGSFVKVPGGWRDFSP